MFSYCLVARLHSGDGVVARHVIFEVDARYVVSYVSQYVVVFWSVETTDDAGVVISSMLPGLLFYSDTDIVAVRQTGRSYSLPPDTLLLCRNGPP